MSSVRVLDDLSIARAGFEARLRMVAPDGWSGSTPCSEWTVSDLVNHVVAQEWRFGRLVAGGSVEEYIATRDDEVLGADPLAAWAEGCKFCDDAIARVGDLETSAVWRFGPLPVWELLEMRIVDMAVHTWDLSRAIGVDDRLDDTVLEMCLRQINGPIGQRPELAALFTRSNDEQPIDASPQQQLLHWAGRR